MRPETKKLILLLCTRAEQSISAMDDPDAAGPAFQEGAATGYYASACYVLEMEANRKYPVVGTQANPGTLAESIRALRRMTEAA